MIKILLLVVIVSLSTLVIPLKGYDENTITEPVTVQKLTIENTGKQVEEIMEVSANETVAINFEFYVYLYVLYLLLLYFRCANTQID